MQEATLPSPQVGGNGHHLRRVAAKAISHVEINAPAHPGAKHPSANTLTAFFQAGIDALAAYIQVAPVNTVAPAAPSGTAQVAGVGVLTALNGTWTGNPNFSYQWQVNSIDVAGATGSTYKPVTADIGKPVRVKVTGYNEQATVTVNSTATANVIA